jgi:Flp pilus assembly protein TadG
MNDPDNTNSGFGLTLKAFWRAFLRRKSGQVAVMFAVCSTLIFTSIGAGVDFSRAFMQRQVLSNAAKLACQYSARPSIVATAYNGSTTGYITAVDNFATTYLQLQNFNLTQTTAQPFSYSMGGASSVTLSASMPTYFLGVAGLSTLPVGVTVSCNNGEIQQTNTQPTTAGSLLINESFETPACSGNCWGTFLPNGSLGLQTNPTTTFPSTVGYTGQTGNQWVVTGYCLEIDHAGITVSTAANGNYVAELNCDNGGVSGSTDYGLSSISNKSYYPAGTYELRYSFQSRVDYPNYDPAYICGSSATDVAWANDTNSGFGTQLRNNEIDVFFDADQNGSAPTHTTLPTQTGIVNGGATLAGSNLIDTCVYAKGWITRSVKITVTTPGYYWLSFAANGANDARGGALDEILVCNVACSGSVPDSFPSAWPNSLLFEDGFETPTYSATTSSYHLAINGNPSTSSASNPGWPSQTAAGWTAAPYNQINYFLSGADQGSQYIGLDGSNSYSGSSSCSNSYAVIQGCTNRLISRPFYLDNGYYEVNYDYLAEVNFSGDDTYCYTAPGTGYIYPGTTSYPSATGSVRYQSTITSNGSTNILGVFMAHGSLVSTPNSSSSLGAATTYTNPDGTVTTTPTVPPDNINWYNYTTSGVNPVIDTCGNVGAWAWLPRTAYVEITKPGVYWLTFSANGGVSDGHGPNIDDVKLTALNSLYGSAPSSYVTIPTPGPAPGSTISYTGFSIVADRLAP